MAVYDVLNSGQHLRIGDGLFSPNQYFCAACASHYELVIVSCDRKIQYWIDKENPYGPTKDAYIMLTENGQKQKM